MGVPIPPTLVRHLREGRCVLFVGAGVSAAAGLPGWKKLLACMVDEIEGEGEDGSAATGQELRRLIDAGKLLDVADHCRERLGERRYLEILGQQLRGGTEAIPEIHQLITKLPFSALVTTNYDKLLERAYMKFRGDLPKVVTGHERKDLGSLLFAGGFFILKAHGDIDDAASLVLTARDYRDIIHANPAFNALFAALLMTKSVLFIGYSLGDPDFRLLLDGQVSAFGENIPERYAVMSGVGPVEGDVLKRSANIKVLPYPDGRHEEVTLFLQALVQRLEAKTSTPTTNPPLSREAELTARLLSTTAPPSPGSNRVRPGLATLAAVDLLIAPASGHGMTPPDSRQGMTESALAPRDLVTAELALAGRDNVLEAVLRHRDQEVVSRSTPADWSRCLQALPSLMQAVGGSPAAREELGARLGALLPVAPLLGLQADALVIGLDGGVSNIPWELATLPNGQPLALTVPVCRAFVGEAVSRGRPGVRQPAQALVIGDPGIDPEVRLPGAYGEAEEIAAVYARGGPALPVAVTLLLREDACLDRVMEALSRTRYDIVHFAGHAWFDGQESYLAFNRDEHLTVTELRSLLGSHPPALLVLNSHYTAFLPRGVGPSEMRDRFAQVGFSSMAASAGVGAFIGCFASPSDEAARRFGVQVHAELLEGKTVCAAVHAARVATARTHPNDLTALQYVLSGHPGYRIR